MPRQATVVGLGVGVTVLAAVLGLLNLGDQQLRLDEATSWYIAQLDWGGWWEAVSTSEANSGVYYALLHLWLAFGDSEVVIRSLSVLFGVGTIPLLYLLGLRLFGMIPAALACVLLAVNAFFVENVQDARGYALATFLVTAASLLFVDVLWRPVRWKSVAYVIVGALAIYAHFFSGLILAMHLVSAAVAGPRPLPQRLAALYGSIVVLTVPVAAFTMTNDVGQIDWIGELTWERLGAGVADLTGNGGALLVLGYAAGLLLAIAVWITAGGERRSFEQWGRAFVLLWALGPVTAAILVSFVKPVFQARYLMGTMPALALAVAAVIAARRGNFRFVAAAIAAVVLALSGAALGAWYEEPGNPWAERVQHIVGAAEPGDGMVFYAPTMLRPYLYYAHRMDVVAELPQLVYPSSLSWPGYSRTRYDLDYKTIADRTRAHGRIWLLSGVTWDEPRQEEFRRLRDTLAAGCPEFERRFTDPTVVLYEGCR